MSDVLPAAFSLPPAGGTAVRICLTSARWFCDLLRSDPPPPADRLAPAVGRLAAQLVEAAEVAGEDAPELFPVRGLLDHVARAVADDPVHPPGDLAGLPDRVGRASEAALRRLTEGRGRDLLRRCE